MQSTHVDHSHPVVVDLRTILGTQHVDSTAIIEHLLVIMSTVERNGVPPSVRAAPALVS